MLAPRPTLMAPIRLVVVFAEKRLGAPGRLLMPSRRPGCETTAAARPVHLHDGPRFRPVFDEAGQLIGPEIHCGPDDVHAVGAAFGEGFGAHVCVFDEQEFDRLLMPVPEDAILVRLEAVVSDE